MTDESPRLPDLDRPFDNVEEFISTSRQFMFRGALRMAILRCLWDRDMHGQEMVLILQQMSGGKWSPSPGSLYPMLKHIEKQGIISRRDQGRTAVYSLTPIGRKLFLAVIEDFHDHMEFLHWMVRLPSGSLSQDLEKKAEAFK